MCGIAGVYYFKKGKSAAADDLKRMTDQMVHRGPDDEGFFQDSQMGLGMRRLSIIDLAGGHQPIATPDQNKVIVFNGEAYNFQEKRQLLQDKGYFLSTNSDTEVVLGLFDTFGTDCFEHINGMFGFAVWDKPAQTLTIARDRIGIKPVYYYMDEEKLVFASEIKAILAFPSVTRALDHACLAQYFKYGFTPDDQTLYKQIKKLPPAHYLQIRDNQVHLACYWHLSYSGKHTENQETITSELYELMQSAVAYRMIADVPLGAFLSSGIDSSSIVHLMHEQKSGRVSTYSIGFGAGYEQFNELVPARRFADRYGTDHHEILVRPDVSNLLPELVTALDEPLADSSFIMTYLVSKLARETVTVILSGVGGDELFGGYRRYLNIRLNRYAQKIPLFVRQNILGPMISRLPEDRNHTLLNYIRLLKAYMGTSSLPASQQYMSYTSLMGDDLLTELLGTQTAYTDHHARLMANCDADDLLDKLLYIDLKTSLPDQLLMLTDKMSMHTSLEARVPYLDHRVVEYAAKIPSDMKIKGFNLRHIQKQTFKNKLPDFVLQQKKKGFGAPVGNWVRKDLKEMMMDLLSPDALKTQGLFNPDAVQSMINNHMTMKEDYTDLLLGLISFQIWWQNNHF
jgi:asparagine synthase (glutamine-hydrolysing)